LFNACRNVLPIDITSPTDFICWSAPAPRPEFLELPARIFTTT